MRLSKGSFVPRQTMRTRRKERRCLLYLQDLEQLWMRRVARGEMINRIRDPAGRNLEVGLRIEDGRPEYFARDVDTGEDLGVRVLRRELGGGAAIHYNEIRGLRPHGRLMGPGAQPYIPTEAGECGANCMNPGAPSSFYRREPLARFESDGRTWVAVRNAFPMSKRWHILWVPAKAHGMLTVLPHQPQAPLDQETVMDFMALARATVGAVTFYNSPNGGGASLGHLHLQSIAGQQVAIPRTRVIPHGRFQLLAGQSASTVCFGPSSTGSDVWSVVAAFQALGPINLISIANQVYLVPRNPNAAVVAEFPGTVMGALEMMGNFFTTDIAVYERATREMVDSALEKASLPIERVMAVLDTLQTRGRE